MRVIVPLAGPDFVKDDGSVKSELAIAGKPLLRRAIESRSWWKNGFVTDANLIFVFHDNPASRQFAEVKLLTWYPAARTVFMSDYARGAAFSALAGCALLDAPQEPICIDLADILFDDVFDVEACFSNASTGAAALTFAATDPAYSYLKRNEAGQIVEAAEKRVISSEASAGVYFFRSVTTYLKALATVADSPETYAYNDLFYVCPVFNGVIATNLQVVTSAVENVQDIKTGLLDRP